MENTASFHPLLILVLGSRVAQIHLKPPSAGQTTHSKLRFSKLAGSIPRSCGFGPKSCAGCRTGNQRKPWFSMHLQGPRIVSPLGNHLVYLASLLASSVLISLGTSTAKGTGTLLASVWYAQMRGTIRQSCAQSPSCRKETKKCDRKSLANEETFIKAQQAIGKSGPSGKFWQLPPPQSLRSQLASLGLAGSNSALTKTIKIKSE